MKTLLGLTMGVLSIVSAGAAARAVPRSDGRVLHVDFENYVDRVIGPLNAGVRWLGYPFSGKKQGKLAIINDKDQAFSGSRCGYAFSRRPEQTSRILLQRRFDAPDLGGGEVVEFVYRPVGAEPVDIKNFTVADPLGYKGGGVGIAIYANGRAAGGTYDLDVGCGRGSKRRVAKVVRGLDQRVWVRIIFRRIKSDRSVVLWVGRPGKEKRIGKYPDRDPTTGIGQLEIGDPSDKKNRGSGYWDDIRVGKKLLGQLKLAPPEVMRDVGKELPKITYPIRVDKTKQLFVDDVVIESMKGLKRMLHPARKHPQNPLVVPDKPWEGNNVLLYGGVIKDPRMGGRFRMWYLAWGKSASLPSFICYAESEDGLKWKKPDLGLMKSSSGSKDNNIVMPGHSDITIIFDPRDPNPAYRYKSMNRYGGHTGWTSPDGFNWTNHGRIISQGYDCSTVSWDPIDRKWVASIKISRAGKRSRGYAESRDFFNWSDTYLMLHSDDKDGPKDQIYAMIVSRYESVYIGLVRMYHTDTDKVDIQLATSRNGRHWDRRFRRNFIPTSDRKGAWDYGNNAPSTCPPIRVGDELWFYYSGRTGTHQANVSTGSIGLATLRVDGFVSVDADNEEGMLMTKPLRLKGSSLYVNADARGGEIRVEIIPASPKRAEPIGPFLKTQCLPIRSDTVRKKVSWQDTDSLESLNSKEVRLRFYIRNAKLYSFWTE